jgi:hypothetical protein
MHENKNIWCHSARERRDDRSLDAGRGQKEVGREVSPSAPPLPPALMTTGKCEELALSTTGAQAAAAHADEVATLATSQGSTRRTCPGSTVKGHPSGSGGCGSSRNANNPQIPSGWTARPGGYKVLSLHSCGGGGDSMTRLVDCPSCGGLRPANQACCPHCHCKTSAWRRWAWAVGAMVGLSASSCGPQPEPAYGPAPIPLDGGNGGSADGGTDGD